jgi:hypothetical protein
MAVQIKMRLHTMMLIDAPHWIQRVSFPGHSLYVCKCETHRRHASCTEATTTASEATPSTASSTAASSGHIIGILFKTMIFLIRKMQVQPRHTSR